MTERPVSNNRQLSEISDSKCEEVALKYVIPGRNYPNHKGFIDALAELERETRRETLRKIVQLARLLDDEIFLSRSTRDRFVVKLEELWK